MINPDLISLGITVVTVSILGFLVFLRDVRNATNQAFFAFSLVTILYAVTNYFSGHVRTAVEILWTLRLTIFFACWHAFSMFYLFYVFPAEKIVLGKWVRYFFIPLTVLTSLATLSPYVFVAIGDIAPVGETTKAIVGQGIGLFVFTALMLVAGGIALLVKKTKQAKTGEKQQFVFVLVGTIITFVFITVFNLVLPALFLNVSLIPLAPLFFLPFVIFTTYAIVRYKLLNIKVIATQLFVFSLWIFIIIRALVAVNRTEFISNLILFSITVIVGIFLMRTVVQEVEQREKIEKQEEALEKANERLKELDQLKSEFVSLASHQIRGPLTAIKGYTSLIMEGDYGEVPKQLSEPIETIFKSSQSLVVIVEDFLNVSRIEQGKMKYDISIFDLNALAQEVAMEMKPTIEKKGLGITLSLASESVNVSGDRGKVKQIIGNLLDNAIKYTPKGGIEMGLVSEKDKGLVRIAIKDTGVGIKPQTMPYLFKKFSRAEDASKFNILGTGLGLYVAKEMIKAQGGKIWAESEGEGKGSTFFVEFKVNQ